MRNRRKYRLLRAILLLTAIVCLIPVGQAYYLSFQHKERQKELKVLLENEKKERQDSESKEKQTTNLQLDCLQRFTDLYSKNNDLTGWLAIEGTDIDYPVMQCEDDAYYLHHNFDKQKDKYGCLYVKGTADVHTPGTNIIIYGHNMKDGAMFGTLDNYRSETFGSRHSTISFDTIYEERTYQIISVFEMHLNDKEVYPYYQFYQADTEEEFLVFYDNIKKLSLYDTGITAVYGDTFLTLSTCSNSGEDSRFVVVAKRTDEKNNICR